MRFVLRVYPLQSLAHARTRIEPARMRIPPGHHPVTPSFVVADVADEMHRRFNAMMRGG